MDGGNINAANVDSHGTTSFRYANANVTAFNNAVDGTFDSVQSLVQGSYFNTAGQFHSQDSLLNYYGFHNSNFNWNGFKSENSVFCVSSLSGLRGREWAGYYPAILGIPQIFAYFCPNSPYNTFKILTLFLVKRMQMNRILRDFHKSNIVDSRHLSEFV